MATATETLAAASSRGNVLTTELDALANGSQSAVGATVVDNSVNLDRFGQAVLTITFGSAPTDRAVIDLYAVPAIDGTNYAYSTQAQDKTYVGSFVVDNVTTEQIMVTEPFELGPHKYKFLASNRSGRAFPASGSTIALYTWNRKLTY